MNYKGGCLCGALRYQAERVPVTTGYCHCSLCRRSTGAPVVAFASFPIDGFTYTRGTPSIYRSSPTGRREFCNQCGTQIAYRDLDDPETVDVNSGTLDNIEHVEPTHHIFTADGVRWLNLGDHLPRYPQGEPGKD
ncbi:GFA family protein [Exilibacterium tricleocarpae]|uniref:GFA family protein n=1 Tax=Exilibacterium tricleocarpae TaxID=2591008 RepID=A0A545T0H8_9GAMM|nr:GFA family protein [Exilibacterium tricleocarpae]TQV70727.1 GFA family protein [Exilibacterium tricleocarpae]